MKFKKGDVVVTISTVLYPFPKAYNNRVGVVTDVDTTRNELLPVSVVFMNPTDENNFALEELLHVKYLTPLEKVIYGVEDE